MAAKVKEATAKVRPVLKWDSAQEKSSLQGVAKVWVNKDTLILLTGGVESGKRCWVERVATAASTGPSDGGSGEGETPIPIRRQALLASSPDKSIGQNVIMMTEAYREASGLKLGDQVSIKAHEDVVVPPAQTIELESIETIENETERGSWEGAIWFLLSTSRRLPDLQILIDISRRACRPHISRVEDRVYHVQFQEKVRGQESQFGR